VFGGLVFFAGVSGSLATIDVLFNAVIERINYQRAAVIAFTLVPSLLWFTLIPRDFAEPAKKGADMEFTSRAVALLVKFIFAPLTYVFAAILLAYSVKVLAQGGFNEARLGQIGVIYSACVVITALLSISDARRRMVHARVLARVAVPAHRAGRAAHSRALHPLRELRRDAAALHVRARRRMAGRAHRRVRPHPLARGHPPYPRPPRRAFTRRRVRPWGATGLTVRNQAGILEALLIKNKLLSDGRLSENASSAGVWIWEDNQRAGSALHEIHNYSGMDKIHGWFEGDAQNPVALLNYAAAYAGTAKRLGVPTTRLTARGGRPSAERTFNAHFRSGNVVATDGAK